LQVVLVQFNEGSAESETIDDNVEGKINSLNCFPYLKILTELNRWFPFRGSGVLGSGVKRKRATG
jgi:hypothetical protein